MNSDPAKNDFEGFFAESSDGKIVLKNPPDSGKTIRILKVANLPVKGIEIHPGESLVLESPVAFVEEEIERPETEADFRRRMADDVERGIRQPNWRYTDS